MGREGGGGDGTPASPVRVEPPEAWLLLFFPSRDGEPGGRYKVLTSIVCSSPPRLSELTSFGSTCVQGQVLISTVFFAAELGGVLVAPDGSANHRPFLSCLSLRVSQPCSFPSAESYPSGGGRLRSGSDQVHVRGSDSAVFPWPCLCSAGYHRVHHLATARDQNGRWTKAITK